MGIDMNRTVQQTAAINAVIAAAQAGGGKHFCLRARAGTGKSTTIVELVDDYTKVFPRHSIVVCAFNKKISVEMGQKLVAHGHDWKTAKAATVHSLGLEITKQVYPKVKIDQWKVANLIEQQNNEFYAEHAANIAQLVSYAKLEGFGFFGDAQVGDVGAWYRVCEHYDINGFDDTTTLDRVVTAAQHIYNASLAQTDVVDFDDMILFPLVKNIAVKWTKDVVIVDEAQDTGRARQALVRKFVKRNGTFIVVGDDRQGIYGFAGAQADALEQLIEGEGMTVLPLTVSFRCPKAVIRLAQTLVPDIEHAADAIEGEVITLDKLPQQMEPTDAILCRNTAPLVQEAFSLIRRGVACKVEGREIGKGLVRLAKRWKVSTISAFLDKLEAYRAREVQKALAKGKGGEQKAQEVEDKCETLVHLCNACIDRRQLSLDDLVAHIETLFADDVSGVVTLCTYHRSKGREFPRVFLLDHAKRCPSPWAKQEWQKRQEENLAYVAFTRAQKTLAFVSQQEQPNG